jgi:putative ABC transport system permease protein
MPCENWDDAMIPITYNLRSLAVRKTTTIATALGIALVVFVLAASQMLASGIRNTLGKSGRDDHALVLRKGADNEMSSNVETRLVNLILASPGVKRDASGKPQGVAELLLVIALEKAGAAGQVSNVTLRGVPDDLLEFNQDIHVVTGRPARAGADEVIIGKRLEGQFQGLRLGESFEIKKNRRVQVVGIFESDGSSRESEILCDVELVRTSFGREGVVSSVTVALESPSKFDSFKAAMEHDKQLGLQAISQPAYYQKQSEGTANLVTFLGGAIVFFFSVGATIGAMITMYAAVSHRKREIGTLRALGFSRFTILSSFLLEAVLLTVIGGAIGALASLGMGFVHFSMMNMNSWSEITFSFDPSPAIVLTAVLVGAFMGVFGGLMPALQAARISPTEAMRD